MYSVYNFSDSSSRAVSKFVENRLTKLYTVSAQAGLWDNIPFHFTPEQKAILDKSFHLKDLESNDKTEGILITLNLPPEEASWEICHAFAKKLISRKNLLSSGMYVLEQRSEDSFAPQGWHVHILTMPFASKSQIEHRGWQTVVATFKAAKLPPPTNKKSLHVVACNYEKKVAYIQGDKEDTKMSKVVVDRILREELGYEHYYEFKNT